MESLYSIGLGLGLRFLIDTATKYHGLRVHGILIGLWEGIILNHFVRQFPSSFDPYIAFAFRMLIDIILTKNISRMTVVLLWTGLGMILSDVVPEVNHDRRYRRMTRPFRRWLKNPNLDFLDYLPSLSDLANHLNPPRPRSRTRTSSSSRPAPSRRPASRSQSTTTRARSPVGESFILTSRRHLPGNYTSETETSATNTNATTSAVSPPNSIMPPLRGILTPSRQSSIISPSPKPTSIIAPSRPPTSILSPPQSTTFFPPNSALSSPTHEVPSHLPRSGVVSPPRSILSTPRSILSPPRQAVHNPPIIQQPAPRHPHPTSIISPPLSAPSPSIASPLPAQLPLSPPHNTPPGGRESDLEYADIPYNHVPQETTRQSHRFPQESQSPPLVADPLRNFESIPMAMPEPQQIPPSVYQRDLDQNRPRPLSDIPEATQSQEASQVSRLSHISHLSSRVSQALSHLPPPSEHTTEGDEREYQSGLESSQYDELDAFTTPPNLAKGSVINDDDLINDPLMTPPANTVMRNMAGVGSGFGETDRGRESDPSLQYQYAPFSAFDDQSQATGRDLSGDGQPGQEARDATSRLEKAPYHKGDNAVEPTPAPTPPTKHKRTESSARPSMIPVRGNSLWGGSDVGVTGPAVRPPSPSSVRGGNSVWGGSAKDEEPATIRVRDQPTSKSNRGSIWGSIWGGSTKDEGSVRDDVSVREDIPVEPVRGDSRQSRESRDGSVKAESVKPPRSLREPSAVRSAVSKVPSVRDDKSALSSAMGERKRDFPLSRQPTGNGSIRGGSALGSVKGEPKPSEEPSQPQPPQRSIRGDRSELDGRGDNISVAAETNKSGLDDAKSSKERAAPLERVDVQKKLNKEAESGAPPTPAKSTASISASASLWSEKPSMAGLPPAPEEPTKPVDPITKNVEGMKGDEALKTVMAAWDQVIKTRAPELKVLVGPGKAGTQLKRKITRSFEDEHNVSPSKTNLREVIFKLPDIPPAISR